LHKRVVIAGGTGAVGRAVAGHFANLGHEVVILTRSPRASLTFEQKTWDGKTVDSGWAELLPDSILINLAGELVDRVPSQANVELLKDSRVTPTKTLVAAARAFGAPALWLQMSTLAIYGDAGDALLDESAPPGSGPRQMTEVAVAWEKTLAGAPAQRIAVLRTGIVLQPNTPALNRLTTMTKRFLGGTVGNGRQWVSWIHIDDFLNALSLIVENPQLSGIVHLTSPNPIRNRDMMAELRRDLHRPWMPPTPAVLVRLGARLVFRTDPQLGLTGRRALPVKLVGSGFVFAFENFDTALKDLLRKS